MSIVVVKSEKKYYTILVKYGYSRQDVILPIDINIIKVLAKPSKISHICFGQ